jgi:hypothetical protein
LEHIHDASLEPTTPAHGYHFGRQVSSDHVKSAVGKVLTVVTRTGTDFEQGAAPLALYPFQERIALPQLPWRPVTGTPRLGTAVIRRTQAVRYVLV